MLNDLDLNTITDLENAIAVIHQLLNLVESFNQENQELKRQLQELRDEISRLKGEQGKPKIRPQKKPSKNNSSEKERKEPEERNKGTKNDRIKTHDTQVCYVDKSVLPKDAQFKGHERVIVQDVKFEAHNTSFLKEKYYSPSLKKTFLAPLPSGYEGEFGPQIKALALKLYFDSNVTQPRILDLFGDADVILSKGQLSNFLIKNHDPFHKEKDALYEAGIMSTCTGARKNGQKKVLIPPHLLVDFCDPS